MRCPSRRVVVAFITFACTIPPVGAAATPPTTTTTTRTAASQPTTRPDPHLWARRNVDLIRDAAGGRREAMASGGIGSVLMFSLGANPLLVREPYTGQNRKLLEDAIARPDVDPRSREMMEVALPFLRLPEEQRILRQLVREIPTHPQDEQSIDKPVVRADNVYNLTSTLSGAPPGEPYDSIVARTIDQMDAAARQAGKWDALALSYLRLARAALEREQPARANGFIDRMLAILREHPNFQDPNRGNTNAVSPGDVASLLVKAGRGDELDGLVEHLRGPHKLDMLLGVLDVQLHEGGLDAARRFVEEKIRPLTPATADRLAAALRGHAATLPATSPWPTPADIARGAKAVRPRPRPDAAELRLRTLLTHVAFAHARRGDVDTAARQWLAIQADELYHPAGWGHLASHEWARLAQWATEGGHPKAARAAFEHALEELARDPIVKKPEYEEKARFVREAIDAGDVDLALSLLQTTSAPGAWACRRLATAYRRAGDHARADRLLAEATEMAQAEQSREGDDLAAVAVDLHAAGEVKRAEALLLDAINHIEGVDFGFSGTAAIVSAAMKMNRLDLLDRCYASYDNPGEKMLLCIVATRAGLYGLDRDSN